MTIIEIQPLENGGHRNQSGQFSCLPAGWAVVPPGLDMENFPFGEVEAEEIDGVMTVTKWTPGVMPEPEPIAAEPTPQDDTDAMLVDHEYRITLLELGVI